MKQSFLFPSDKFTFGKYIGKEIAYVIDTDKSYYNWAISQGMQVSEIIHDYYNGIDVISYKITPKIIKKTDTLQIIKLHFYLLPKEKFVRRKDVIKVVKKEILAEHKIKVPSKIQSVIVTHNWLGDGIQSDDIHLSSSREVFLKEYDKEMLEKFIEEKLKDFFVVS